MTLITLLLGALYAVTTIVPFAFECMIGYNDIKSICF